MSLNESFLNTLTRAFQIYLQTSARSNEKLKILHAKIATDLASRLGRGFSVCGYGIGDGKEKTLQGRYYEKAADISVFQNGVQCAGVAVKFVMSNYSQNANNYFEAMLGETANLRARRLPYFQVLVLPEAMPYFERDGDISRIEELREHHLHKYLALSQDNPSVFFHTPNKTLLAVVRLPDFTTARNKAQYKAICAGKSLSYSRKILAIGESRTPAKFGESVVYNDYEMFLNKVYHRILAQ